MAGSDEGVVCQRNAKCRCRDCISSATEFSINDLKAFSSTINYGESCTI
jgi:hypothetical protein